MKPLDQYPTVEEMQADAVREPQWRKIPEDARPQVLNRLRERWEAQYSARKEGEGAGPQDLQQHTDGMAHKIAHFLSQVALQSGLTNRVDPKTGQVIKPGEGNTVYDWTVRQEPGYGLVSGHDPVQGAIDLALFGVGPEAVEGKAMTNAFWRLTKRLAIPTTAGLAGGTLEGKPVTGAATGFFEGLGGETIAGIGKFGNRTIQALDFERLKGWLEPRLGVEIPDMAAFRKWFTNGEVIKEAEANHAKVLTRVERKLGPNFQVQANVPMQGAGSATGTTTLRQIDEHLNTLEQQGWRADHSPTPTHAGRVARDQVHQIEGDVAQQLYAANKTAGQEWYTSRGRMRTARTLKNFFDEPGMISDNDKINFIKGQELSQSTAPGGYAHDLAQSMGEPEQKSFAKMLRRGAPEGTNDRAGRGILSGDKDRANVTMTTHGGFWGHVSMPWPSRHVGAVPFDLGRGRALSALITLGPERFFSTLKDMSGVQPTDQGALPAH